MAVQAKRIRSTDKTKLIVYIGDQKNPKGEDYPIFIAVERGILNKIGGAKKFDKVPSGSYSTRAGLSYTIFKDDDGMLWKKTTGTVKGVNYSNTTLVTIGKYRNPLTLFLAKTEIRRVSGTTATAPTSIKVRLQFPNVATEATVQAFILSTITPSLIVGQKFGKVLVATGKILKTTRGTPASKKEPQVVRYAIMGTITDGAANTNGALNQSKGKSAKSVVIAQFTEAAAEAFGFKNVQNSTASDVKEGTKILASNSDKRFVGYSVVDKPILRDSVWSDSGDDTSNQNLSYGGSGTTAKVRFNYVDTGRQSVASGRFASVSTYVKFACPSGTPVGMIAKFIVNLKRYGVSFQVSTDGKNYGTSYPLPSKPGMALPRSAGNRDKVRNRRRGAKK